VFQNYWKNADTTIIAKCLSCSASWHNRLNKKATAQGVSIYKLIPKPRREAQLVYASVAAKDLNRDTDRRYTVLQQRLEDAWSKYETNDITTSYFLKTVSHLYGVPDMYRLCICARQHVNRLCCVCFTLY
jgi:hypothetical protein